jgi:hypothetical protein
VPWEDAATTSWYRIMSDLDGKASQQMHAVVWGAHLQEQPTSCSRGLLVEGSGHEAAVGVLHWGTEAGAGHQVLRVRTQSWGVQAGWQIPVELVVVEVFQVAGWQVLVSGAGCPAWVELQEALGVPVGVGRSWA